MDVGSWAVHVDGRVLLWMSETDVEGFYVIFNEHVRTGARKYSAEQDPATNRVEFINCLRTQLTLIP